MGLSEVSGEDREIAGDETTLGVSDTCPVDGGDTGVELLLLFEIEGVELEFELFGGCDIPFAFACTTTFEDEAPAPFC